jgi:hypothetical protein
MYEIESEIRKKSGLNYVSETLCYLSGQSQKQGK